MNIDPDQFWRIVNAYVKVIRREGDHAVVKCPLGHTDAWLHLNARVAFVQCRHGKCQGDIRVLNESLKEALTEAFGDEAFSPCAADPKQEAERKHLWKVQAITKARVLPRLIEQGPISVDDWLRASPYDLSQTPVEDHWRLKLKLFRPYADKITDHIWCGKLSETGGPQFAWNFKTIDEWLREELCPGAHICQCLFGSHEKPIAQRGISIQHHGSRGGKWTRHNPWIVLESDDIPFEQFGHVILYATESLGLPLKALVDTGNKSGHAWCVRPEPPEEVHAKAVTAALPADFWREDEESSCKYGREAAGRYWDELGAAQRKDAAAKVRFQQREAHMLAALKGLTCDPKLWHVNSTARLPGCIRLDDGDEGGGEPILDATGQPRWQRLIYYDPTP